MNRETIRRQAETIHNQQQATRANWERMGMALPSIMTASVDEIEAHLVMVAEVSEATGANLDAAKLWGQSREQVEAVAAQKTRNNKKRAGARALVAKYGKDGAERIIERKTGRRVNLQD